MKISSKKQTININKPFYFLIVDLSKDNAYLQIKVIYPLGIKQYYERRRNVICKTARFIACMVDGKFQLALATVEDYGESMVSFSALTRRNINKKGYLAAFFKPSEKRTFIMKHALFNSKEKLFNAVKHLPILFLTNSQNNIFMKQHDNFKNVVKEMKNHINKHTQHETKFPLT